MVIGVYQRRARLIFDVFVTFLGHTNRNFDQIVPKSSRFPWKLLKFSILVRNSHPTRKLRFLGPENGKNKKKIWSSSTLVNANRHFGIFARNVFGL